ncbi:MAG: ABC transporter substrate-binding protein [Lagierella massiliensis]|nr:ABC transporter substrate-binding protein [Lagierella massiliensis]
MKKKIVAIMLACMMLLVSCKPDSKGGSSTGSKENESVQTGGQIIVRHFGDPMSWDPDKLPDDNGYPIFQNIFNRLVKLDASKQVIPDLAESWDISEDAKEITFHLRENAKWHDGEKVTSEDVKYTFEKIKSDPQYLMNTKFQNIESFDVVDDYTITFKLKDPDISLIAELGWYSTFIMPKHVLDNGKPWEENEAIISKPIGSGPFKLENYVQGESITIVKNEDYWEGSPKLDKVVYSIIPDDATAVQALVNGELDVLENVPSANAEQLLQDENLRMEINRYPSPMRLIFNMENEKVKDVAVRKAISYAIDKEEISKKIFHGLQKPEYTMYPSLIEEYANTTDVSPKFNIDEAIKILEEAGYTKDKDGYYVRGLEVEVFEGGGYPDAAKLMEATLKEAGIEMKINVSEYNAWAEKVGTSKDYIMELQGGFMGPDPSALQARYATGESNNWSLYANPEFDKLVIEANKEADSNKRAELYKEAQKILAEDAVFVPIIEFASYDANSKNYINLPIDGEGKWGWAEFTFTEMVK